jgi:uncharacterized membrane protein YqiK
MNHTLAMILLMALVLFIPFVIFFAIMLRCLKNIPAAQAAIINKPAGAQIVIGPSKLLVMPIIHAMETIDLTPTHITLIRAQDQGILFADNVRGDLIIHFHLRIKPTAQDILQVAQLVGCTRASLPETLTQLFEAKLIEAIKTVAKVCSLNEWRAQQEVFISEIKKIIGDDLHGYSLDLITIESLKPTALAHLDPHNILDAQGIKKAQREGRQDAPNIPTSLSLPDS